MGSVINRLTEIEEAAASIVDHAEEEKEALNREYDEKTREELPVRLAERIKEADPRYECVITVDYDYVAKPEEGPEK